MGGLPSRRGGGRKEVMGRRKSKPALEPPHPTWDCPGTQNPAYQKDFFLKGFLTILLPA